jgi:selenide,water dikinase
MLRGDLDAEIDTAAVPILPGAAELAERGMVPGGTRRNLEHAAATTDFGTASEIRRTLLADAQTSGGLLIAVPAGRVGTLLSELEVRGVASPAVVGRITEGTGRIRLIGA